MPSAAAHARCCRRTPPHTTHHRKFSGSATILRQCHPLQGQALPIMGGMRRGGAQLLLLILPDGSRSLIPAEWTDWQAEDAGSVPASSPQEACFVPLAGLLRVRAMADALLKRGPIPGPGASSHEESHAADPCPSRTSPAAARASGSDRSASLPDSAGDSRAHPRSSRRNGKARGARP